MSRGRVWGALGVALFAVAIFAAPARSAPRPQRHRGPETQAAETSGFVYLGKSDGYEVGLSLSANRIAVLFVSRLRQTDEEISSSTTRYVARTKTSIDGGKIDANFGSIGRVSLRFHRKRPVRVGHNQRGCSGPKPTHEMGAVRGSVRLHGERGYFRASFHRGFAELRRSFRLVCRHGRAYETGAKPLWEYATPGFTVSYSSAGGAIAVLYATHRRHGRWVGLRAAHYQGQTGSEVQLETLEGSPGMPVGRSAYIEGGPGILRTSIPGEQPATATLAPTAPFSGEAMLVGRSPKYNEWDGSLRVGLPGLDLPLTGHGWYTSLCVVSALKTPEGCDFI
jgi:hypothetical protein